MFTNVRDHVLCKAMLATRTLYMGKKGIYNLRPLSTKPRGPLSADSSKPRMAHVNAEPHLGCNDHCVLSALTTSYISFDILSLSTARSFLTSPMKAFTFLYVSSGVKPSCPTAHLTTPSFSLYSLTPTKPFTVPVTSFVIVPNFVRGINPLGPSILPNPA